MKQISGIAVVFLTAVPNVYVAVPAGYGFDLDPKLIGVFALAGSVGGTVVMVFVGDRIWPRVRSGWRRLRAREEEPPEAPGEAPGRAERIIDRFGAPGLGLIAPFTIGGFAGAITGVAAEIPRARLALWLGPGQAIFVTLYALLLDAAVAE